MQTTQYKQNIPFFKLKRWVMQYPFPTRNAFCILFQTKIHDTAHHNNMTQVHIFWIVACNVSYHTKRTFVSFKMKIDFCQFMPKFRIRNKQMELSTPFVRQMGGLQVFVVRHVQQYTFQRYKSTAQRCFQFGPFQSPF